MTLSPENYFLWYKDYPTFTQWALQRDVLFIPKEFSETEEDKQYNLESKAYLLMKRLGQDYEQVMRMDSESRDNFFDLEMSLIEEESKEKEEN